MAGKKRKQQKVRDVKFKTGRVLVGSCLERLRDLPDGSIDSIVTDPPYELGFMGKSWDASGIAYNVELWRECLRVLKPGGHLLAFGGTRTYHRMAVAIEDAGFEIRDSIHWVYGSGFPKSLDVSKAIDKQRHDRADVYKVTAWIRERRDAAGITNKDIDAAFGLNGMAGHWTSSKSQPAVPTLEQIPTLLNVLGVEADDVPEEMRRLLWDLNGKKGQPGENWTKREIIGTKTSGIANKDEGPRHTIGASKAVEVDITASATDEAKQWEGWGTALKPAHEPIVLARKPLVGTVAANVLAHGTGALNIDGCRIGRAEGDVSTGEYGNGGIGMGGVGKGNGEGKNAEWVQSTQGRWPANVIFDEAAGEELDAQSGVSKTPTRVTRGAGGQHGKLSPIGAQNDVPCYGDTGGASRFFYCPKPGKKERNAGLDGLPEKQVGPKGNGLARKCAICGASTMDGCQCPDRTFENPQRQNFHPTVKPIALMRYLVRLVTPPNGTVLDPFLGSGTTAVSAILEGFTWVGCEMTDDYLPIIRGRVQHAQRQSPQL